MNVSSLRLENFRSFKDSGSIELGNLNVLVGANNSGKTSLLRALHQLQSGLGDPFADVRAGCNQYKVTIQLEDVKGNARWGPGETGSARFTLQAESLDRRQGSIGMQLAYQGNYNTGNVQLEPVEPHHFIVPYFSKRKTAGYAEQVGEAQVLGISSDMGNLAAKLSRLANPQFPKHKRYSETCEAILGFVVTAIPSANGQRPGVYLDDMLTLPIDQMGEGVPNIVHLLASLALSEGKLFLMEEPENDLHPQALKALLDLIIESSKGNQFVISTHSNIVVRHLCGLPQSRLFQINAIKRQLPTEATIAQIDPTPQARLAVLQDLGYSLADFDLWDGWLILEESSAERIIRDYLIPWFVPKMSRIRTMATGGINQVESTFDDFHRMVLFTHLQPIYRNKAWVRVDGDAPGNAIVERLRSKYPEWQADRFGMFEEAQFERYYPAQFLVKTEAALMVGGRQDRREAKKALLKEVMVWLDEDRERGEQALRLSAGRIIADLKVIEAQL